MPKKKTQNQYIKELSEKNPNLEVIGDYLDTKTPILHLCKRHNEIHYAMPQNALSSGLKCCRSIRYNKITNQDFIERSKKIYGAKFDYSRTEYKDSETNIIIGCPNHGFVSVRPSHHLKVFKGNKGCNQCGIENSIETRTIGKVFIESEEKICSKCGQKKPFLEFPKHSEGVNGLYSWCKGCTNQKNKVNKEKKRADRKEKMKAENPGAAINPSKYANSFKKAFFFPETNEKICSKCGQKKTIRKFYKHKETQDGFHSWCKDCCKLGNQKSIKKKYSTFEGRIPTFLRSCSESAKKRGHECTITAEDLLMIWEEQKGKCKYSGIPMTTQPSKMNSVSVERVDSDNGYTKENTVLVCNHINRMKSDLELEQFIYLCSEVYKYNS